MRGQRERGGTRHTAVLCVLAHVARTGAAMWVGHTASGVAEATKLHEWGEMKNEGQPAAGRQRAAAETAVPAAAASVDGERCLQRASLSSPDGLTHLIYSTRLPRRTLRQAAELRFTLQARCARLQKSEQCTFRNVESKRRVSCM